MQSLTGEAGDVILSFYLGLIEPSEEIHHEQ